MKTFHRWTAFAGGLALVVCSAAAQSSNDNNGDPLIPAAEVGIAFEFLPGLQQTPGGIIRLRPVLSEDAADDLTSLREFVQPLLRGDANVTASPGGTVTVDDFQHGDSLPPSHCQLVIQTLQRLVHRRPIGLEIDRFDL